MKADIGCSDSEQRQFGTGLQSGDIAYKDKATLRFGYERRGFFTRQSARQIRRSSKALLMNEWKIDLLFEGLVETGEVDCDSVLEVSQSLQRSLSPRHLAMNAVCSMAL